MVHDVFAGNPTRERTTSERALDHIRVDIQALRALAVSAVFAYHLWPRLLPGGFVGVDVFFVISGFLITGNLVREADGTGRIRIVPFWARRARRLLPAALVVLALTSLGVIVWAPQNYWPQFLTESIAATLYVQNWVLAGNSVDYLAASNMPSPVQHFWTLSVEEQFYFLVPLILIALLVVARRVGHRRRILAAGIAAVSVASFIDSIWLTAGSPPAAYFVTTTRAWEFGVGALLLFGPPPPSMRVARAAVVLGLLGISGACIALSGRLPFPGVTAAWPVLAAAAVLWGGIAIGPAWDRVAALPPVQFIGGISYSMYLWHWPLIVLTPYAVGHVLHLGDRVAIVAATIALAAFSTRFIENPIRFSPRLLGGDRRPRTIWAWSATAMAVSVAIAGGGLAASDARRTHSDDVARVVVQETPQCLGAMAIVNADRCRGVVAADVLIPDPAVAGTDSWNNPACWAGVNDPTLRVCTFGPPNAAIRLAAIGDSHNNALLVAWQAIAEHNGWRIDVAGHNGCYWTTVVQTKPVPSMVDACEAWKRSLNARLEATPPYDAILVTNARFSLPPRAAPGQDVTDLTVAGLASAWKSQTVRGTRIIAIRDNPRLAGDIVACVVKYREKSDYACSISAADGLGPRDALVEAARQSIGATVVDLTDIYCPAGRCLPVIGNVVVYQDRDHLTATFVRTLVTVLSDRIRAALP